MKRIDAEGIWFAIGTSYINDFINGVTPENSVIDGEEQDNKLTPNDTEVDYKKVLAQNEKLKVLVIILSVSLLIAVLIILKLLIKKKQKNEYDFEIEIEELK